MSCVPLRLQVLGFEYLSQNIQPFTLWW
uniref:Uncharacterized protein n=1 Tax=Anguilla anguilla TaxID=7936 RepID=A0A0E9QVL0_ANGAN